MIAHVVLEAIGYDQTQLPFSGSEVWKLMPWVAEVVGHTSTEALRLRFLERDIRFEESNSTMSRGVMFHFYPETGKCYAAFRRTSWKSSDRYFFRVLDDCRIVEISEEEAHSWAEKSDWGKTCSQPALSALRGP